MKNIYREEATDDPRRTTYQLARHHRETDNQRRNAMGLHDRYAEESLDVFQ
jgi:hypothetical protein